MKQSLSPVLDEPTLSEHGGIRYLHFGTEWIQGAMRAAKPSELVLAYTRQMMAWLLFVQPGSKDDIGILGLGAGSLLRYTLRHTRSQIHTVEWNPAVTACCRAYFRLPANARSSVVHNDAAIWVREPEQRSRFVALMVDLYDGQAMGPVRSSEEFYRDCHHALADSGVMTVNLFGNHDSFPVNLQNIRKAFDGQVLELPEIDEGNRVVLAFKAPLPGLSVTGLLARAQELESSYQLPEASRWARELLAACQEPGAGISLQ